MFLIVLQNFSSLGSILNELGCFKNEKYGDFRKLSKAQVKVNHTFIHSKMTLCSIIKLKELIWNKNTIRLHW